MDTEVIYNLIKEEYEIRKMKWPTPVEGIMWMVTEVGEVCEQSLAQTGGWVRNNPDDHDHFSPRRFAEELADVIFMALVTAIVAGCEVGTETDPFEALMRKALRKIADAQRALDNPDKKAGTF